MWDTPQNRLWLSNWIAGWLSTGVSLTWDLYEDGYIWMCRFSSPTEWPAITTDVDADRLALAQTVLSRIS